MRATGVLDPARVRGFFRTPYGALALILPGVFLLALALGALIERSYDVARVADKVAVGDRLYVVDVNGRDCWVRPGTYATTRVGDDLRCRWNR